MGFILNLMPEALKKLHPGLPRDLSNQEIKHRQHFGYIKAARGLNILITTLVFAD